MTDDYRDYTLVDPDNPLVEGDREYEVRLLFRVNANDPEHARTRFIQMLNEEGLTTWTYFVTESETGQQFFVTDGIALTPEEFVAARDAERADLGEADDDTDDTDKADDADDAGGDPGDDDA